MYHGSGKGIWKSGSEGSGGMNGSRGESPPDACLAHSVAGYCQLCTSVHTISSCYCLQSHPVFYFRTKCMSF